MKRYILLSTFFDMGGGQLYTRNKTDYLKKNGWKVDVYTGRTGQLMLSEMSEYENNYYKELNFSPFYASPKRRKEIIDIISQDRDYEEIVIESAKQPMALWGELIAANLGAKHVFFDLDENFPVYDKWYYEFIDFKHQRRELAGIMPFSLIRMFNKYKEVSATECYSLKFLCENTISEQNNYVMEGIAKTDINFGCISRLDKDYIIPMMEEVVKFSQAHPQLSVSFVLVGDSTCPSILERLKAIASQAEHMRFYALGYLSPIPKALIDYVDYFIGTSGSAVMTAAAGKITIAVDTVTCVPIGIIGYDIDTGIFADNNAQHTLFQYLEHLHFQADKNKITSKIRANKNLFFDYMEEFHSHMAFIQNSEPEKEYFAFHNIDIISKFQFLLIRMCGVERAKKIKHLLKKQ